MNFSQYAGVAIVPTLSRLVLAGVFVLAGYHKVFTPAEFEATVDGTGPANVLNSLGVNLTLKPVVARRSASIDGGEWTIVRTSLRQDTPTDAPDDPAPPAAADSEEPQTEPEPEPESTITAPVPDGPTPPVAGGTTLAPGIYTTASLHHITVMLHERQWPMPKVWAWAVALAELLGGALLLIGLFSRLCGLALASVMAGAFYLTSLPVLQTTQLLEIPPQQSTTMFFHCALFVLALGIFMTGPGPLSVDRILFEKRPSATPDDHKNRP